MKRYKNPGGFGHRIKLAFIALLFVVSLIFFGHKIFYDQVYNSKAAYDENTNLRYFGYFHVECSSQLNEIPNLSRIGNVNIIYLNILDEQSYPRCLQSAKDNNVKVILSPVAYFWGDTYYSKNPILASDRVERYDHFKSLILPYKDNIYAFYFDEPVLRKVPQGDFAIVTGTLRTDYYPQIGIFVFENWRTVDSSSPPPPSYYQNVTDFGFDWYANWSTFSNWSIDRYKTYYSKFISKLYSSGQKIWLVPQTFTTNPNPNIALMESILNDYYSFAQTDPRIVGILNFVFSTHSADEALGYSLSTFFDSSSIMYNQPGAASYRGLHSKLAKTITNVLAPKDVLLSSNVSVSASSTDSSTSPGNVVDGKITTNWNSGGNPGNPTKWIELNFSKPQTVSIIRMLPNQTPSGRTVNTIQVKRAQGKRIAGETYRTKTFNMSTDSSTWIMYVPGLPLTNVQSIRFTTWTSPSWVSWKEIEVYGPAE